MTTEKNRIQIGLEAMEKIDGEMGKATKQLIDQISPDLTNMILGLFGEVYTREELDLQQRELVAVSTLLAMGDCPNQLRMHTIAALEAGVTRKQLIEVLIQDVNYCGIPRVLNAAQTILDLLSSDND